EGAEGGLTGERVEPQLEVARVAGQAGPCEARRLAGRGREALVATAAGASAREHGPDPGPGQVRDQVAVGVEHLRADRHAQLDVAARSAVPSRAAAAAALARCEPLPPLELGKVAQVGGDDEYDGGDRTAPRDVP